MQEGAPAVALAARGQPGAHVKERRRGEQLEDALERIAGVVGNEMVDRPRQHEAESDREQSAGVDIARASFLPGLAHRGKQCNDNQQGFGALSHQDAEGIEKVR